MVFSTEKLYEPYAQASKRCLISIMSGWQHIFDGADERTLVSGEALFRREGSVHVMYLVRSGQIALERPMADGTALTLQVA